MVAIVFWEDSIAITEVANIYTMRQDLENEVRKLWKSSGYLPQGPRESRAGGKKFFVHGPPYTTGRTPLRHRLEQAIKDGSAPLHEVHDSFLRSRGQAGWDMHGLPTSSQGRGVYLAFAARKTSRPMV